MKHSKFYFCLATALFLVVLRTSAVYSADFIDTFDDPSFTSSNWTTYATGAQQNWSQTPVNGTDYGYHASASGEDPIAAKLADNGAEYDNAGLVIETLVRLDSHPDIYTSENMVGVAFSVSQNTGYTAGIEQDYDGGTDILFSLGIVEGDAICEMPVDISFDTFYKLVVYMDSTMQITAWLFSSDDTLLGTLSMGNILSLQRGAVAIYGGPAVTFNSFKINDYGSIPSNRLTKTQVSQLYVSIFGRASEGEGNTYWQTQPDIITAAKTMLDTQAAKDYFGISLNTNQAFIEHIYINTLNKTIAEDPGGIRFWVNLLDSGTTRGEAVASLVGVIKEYAPDGQYYDPDDMATVAAYNQFTNRVEVSDYMADNVWDAPEDWETSTSFSNALIVTYDPATVVDAKNAIDLFNLSPPSIELSMTVVELEIGESTNITFGGGSGSFSVVNSNPDVADAFVSGNNLGITGLSGGNITLVVMDSEGASADVSVTVTSLVPNPVLCGAYIAPGVWKEFDCYNLAAIGKTTSDDPFTPSWRLNGGYWQWGRKGPDPSQWYDTNTEHFAHGPKGEGPSETNEDSISSWDGDAAPDDAWSGCIKTPSDPCPEGFRVPTMTTWEGILDNNIASTVGTWGINTTNYSSAQFFGSDLMLPAAGFRNTTSSGALTYRGYNGRYWSSSKNSSHIAGGLYFFNGDLTTGYSNRCFGFSVRCISE